MNRTTTLAATDEAIITFIAAATTTGPGATNSATYQAFISEAHQRGMTAVLDYAASNGVDLTITADGITIEPATTTAATVTRTDDGTHTITAPDGEVLHSGILSAHTAHLLADEYTAAA